MTEQEAKKIVGRLICLGRVAEELNIPMRIAARWIRVADLPGFTDNVEKHVRALACLFDNYRANHPDMLARCDRDTRLIVSVELDDVRKQLALIPKIAQGTVVLDIGDNYLPREITVRHEL